LSHFQFGLLTLSHFVKAAKQFPGLFYSRPPDPLQAQIAQHSNPLKTKNHQNNDGFLWAQIAQDSIFMKTKTIKK
jgi:hypothetical protein